MKNFITPQELKNQFPLQNHTHIDTTRRAVASILLGQDPRTLLIVGPCSIHSLETAKEYARKLQTLSQEVGDVFLVCMRTYFEKSRTALGWKGLLYDPFLDGTNDIEEGLKISRELLLYLSELGIGAATEFLEPLSPSYLGDLISWGAIGARTCQSPIHRQLVSSLDMPVGFKNRCDGNIDIAIHACLTAKEPHHFIGISDDGNVCQVHGKGNTLVHIVLRGSEIKPNYDALSIQKAGIKLKQANLLQAIVVDCSHDNAQKKHTNQEAVFANVIEQISSTTTCIRGIMLESFIEAGSQNTASKQTFLNKKRAQSITDPCLDWQTTERIICKGAELLRENSNRHFTTKVLTCV